LLCRVEIASNKNSGQSWLFACGPLQRNSHLPAPGERIADQVEERGRRLIGPVQLADKHPVQSWA